MKPLQYLFIAVGLTEIFAEVTNNDLLRFITKPLLMPTLVAFYIQAAGGLNRIHKLMVAAFFFSWIGDVTLMLLFVNENLFLVGLVSFLITHILYTISFGGVSNKSITTLLRKRVWVLVPLAIYLVALLSALIPGITGNEHTKPILVPVLIYTTAIGIMVVFAINRYGRVSDKSFALVFGGALLFMLSDSVIAINKFLQPFNIAGIVIMSTYITAQYLIAKGMLAQFLPVRDKE
ncbi:MAG TPA: lysoplasmalogenase [Chitinophagales bacterium]|nr:lysoplasmalogenase [Chitinophagales bacterium]